MKNHGDLGNHKVNLSNRLKEEDGMRPDIHICALVLPLCVSSLAHTNYYYYCICHNPPPTTTLPHCPPYKPLPTTNIATTSTVSSLTHSSSSRPTVSTGWIYSGADPLSVPSLQWTGVAALEKSSPSLFHLFAPPPAPPPPQDTTL